MPTIAVRSLIVVVMRFPRIPKIGRYGSRMERAGVVASVGSGVTDQELEPGQETGSGQWRLWRTEGSCQEEGRGSGSPASAAAVSTPRYAPKEGATRGERSLP